MTVKTEVTETPELTAAFSFCREIARREAKNFYYSFQVLPRHKSDAMCAVYAFMRRADDIADDEAKTVPERRAEMQRWLAGWRVARSSYQPFAGGQDPVFAALSATQARFNIPDALLEDLVRGTMMDLDEESDGSGNAVIVGNGLRGYQTFPDLYRYCYLVASVVGLVIIRIFGYTDPAAELLAEKTGVAFQLTNILRDVKEDAERGRIYLPQEMLQEFSVSNTDLLDLTAGKVLRPNERAMLVALSVQAWQYYEAANQLLALIDPDSRAALWVLVKIYSSLLAKIDERQGDVFSVRVRVSTPRKLGFLLRGAAMALRARIER
jgi:phytoene synthase